MSELKRTLNRRDVAVITVGGVIGSGIFLVPGSVLRNSGHALGLALAVWIVGGFLSYLGALTYAELGAMRPSTGGLYVYIREAFGPLPAFLYGWTLFLVISSGTVATLAVATTSYLQQFVVLSPALRMLCTTVICIGLAAINIKGTRDSTVFMTIATVLKVGAIAVLVIALPIGGHGFSAPIQWAPATWSLGLMSSVGVAMVAVLWAFEGWQYTTFIAGETIDPQRNFPWGIGVGTLALIVIYLAAVLAYVAGIGPDAVAGSERVAADAVSQVFGPTWGKLIAVPIIISMLSAANANTLTSSRVYYAMARDGVFFKKMGEIHPKFGTPAFAIAASTAWAAVLATTGTFETLLTYVVFVGWIFYGLAGLAVIPLRRKHPEWPRPYKVPGYPYLPILFVLSAVAIVVSTIADDPKKGVIGIGASLLGIPVYVYWNRNHTSSTPEA